MAGKRSSRSQDILQALARMLRSLVVDVLRLPRWPHSWVFLRRLCTDTFQAKHVCMRG